MLAELKTSRTAYLMMAFVEPMHRRKGLMTKLEDELMKLLKNKGVNKIKLLVDTNNKEGKIYVLDEPTTGLHMADIDNLMKIIKNLVKNNNTVVVIEHNLDVIKQADWVIDLGPEGGSKGGEILFEGTPENLIKCEKSYTGKYLKKII